MRQVVSKKTLRKRMHDWIIAEVNNSGTENLLILKYVSHFLLIFTLRSAKDNRKQRNDVEKKSKF